MAKEQSDLTPLVCVSVPIGMEPETVSAGAPSSDCEVRTWRPDANAGWLKRGEMWAGLVFFFATVALVLVIISDSGRLSRTEQWYFVVRGCLLSLMGALLFWGGGGLTWAKTWNYVTADAHGLRLRRWIGWRVIPWHEIRGVEHRQSHIWVSLDRDQRVSVPVAGLDSRQIRDLMEFLAERAQIPESGVIDEDAARALLQGGGQVTRLRSRTWDDPVKQGYEILSTAAEFHQANGEILQRIMLRYARIALAISLVFWAALAAFLWCRSPVIARLIHVHSGRAVWALTRIFTLSIGPAMFTCTGWQLLHLRRRSQQDTDEIRAAQQSDPETGAARWVARRLNEELRKSSEDQKADALKDRLKISIEEARMCVLVLRREAAAGAGGSV